MQKAFWLCLFWVCLVCASPPVSSQPINKLPTPEQGMLDLSDWDFSHDKPISLNVFWGFYWNEFLSPTDSMPPSVFMQVPNYWSHGGLYPEHGFATYRLKIKLKQGTSKPDLALKILDISNSYRLYVNGKLLASVGTAGQGKAGSVPEIKPQIIALPDSTFLDIVVHVANFSYIKGGIWDTVLLGNRQALEAKRNSALIYSMFLVGAVFVICLYYLGQYFLLPEEISSLYFSLLCLLAIFRIMATGEMLVLELMPNIPWEWRMKMEHVPFYLMISIGAWFMHSLFPLEFNRKVAKLLLIIGGSCTGLCVLFPATVHSHLVVGYKFFIILAFSYFIYSIILAIRKRRYGALAFFLGFVFIFITSINDILHSENIISTFFMVPIGIFAFFFCQAIVLAAKLAGAYRRTRELSQEIAKLNVGLEQNIEERTMQIEQKRQQMELLNQNLMISEAEARMNAEELSQTLDRLKSTQTKLVESEKMATLGQLTAGIAHEINNPLNFIGVGVDVFAELIGDLKEVVRLYEKLEQSQTPSEVEAVKRSIAALKKQIMYDTIFKDIDEVLGDVKMGIYRTNEIVNGLRTFSRGVDTVPLPTNIHLCLDSSLTILKTQYKNRIDIIRYYDSTLPDIICLAGPINQVFINIIGNAIHAIQEEGVITITTSKKGHDHIAICISDTGMGIPPEIRQKILEPFFTTKPMGVGTGLGLAISLDIIKRHKGCLEIESEVGKGSFFTVVLPISMD